MARILLLRIPYWCCDSILLSVRRRDWKNWRFARLVDSIAHTTPNRSRNHFRRNSLDCYLAYCAHRHDRVPNFVENWEWAAVVSPIGMLLHLVELSAAVDVWFVATLPQDLCVLSYCLTICTIRMDDRAVAEAHRKYSTIHEWAHCIRWTMEMWNISRMSRPIGRRVATSPSHMVREQMYLWSSVALSAWPRHIRKPFAMAWPPNAWVLSVYCHATKVCAVYPAKWLSILDLWKGEINQFCWWKLIEQQRMAYPDTMLSCFVCFFVPNTMRKWHRLSTICRVHPMQCPTSKL